MNSQSCDMPSAPNIIAQHTILRELGRGGMGVVYEADFQGQRRALKLLLEQDLINQERFLREAQAVAAVDAHPNIVRVFSYGIDQSHPYISFEYVEGQSLDRILERQGPVDLDAALATLKAAASALAHVHASGITHRDLKPANILIRSADGQVMLADFGLAKDVDKQSLTNTGEILGTPRFMAPEQVEGQRQAIGPHTDIWALAVCFVEMLTGRPLFSGPTLLSIGHKILSFKSSQLLKMTGEPIENLPAPLLAILLRCLEAKVSERTGSANELLSALNAFENGDSAPMPRSGKGSLKWVLGVSALALSLLCLTWLQRSRRSAALTAFKVTYKEQQPALFEAILLRLCGLEAPATEAQSRLWQSWAKLSEQQPPAFSAVTKRTQAMALALLCCQPNFQSSEQVVKKVAGDLKTLFEARADKDDQGLLTDWWPQSFAVELSRAQQDQLKAALSFRSARRQRDFKQAAHRLESLARALPSQQQLRALSQKYKTYKFLQCQIAESMTYLEALAQFEAFNTASGFNEQVTLEQVSVGAQELCKQALLAPKKLYTIRQRLDDLSNSRPSLKVPKLNEATWQQLLSAEDDVYERLLMALRRSQDGFRDLPKGLGPQDMFQWLKNDVANFELALASELERFEISVRVLNLYTEAMKADLYIAFHKDHVQRFKALRTLKHFENRYKGSIWVQYWHARFAMEDENNIKHGDLKARFILAKVALAKLIEHPQASDSFKDFLTFQMVRVLLLLKKASQAPDKKQAINKELEALRKHYANLESPFSGIASTEIYDKLKDYDIDRFYALTRDFAPRLHSKLADHYDAQKTGRHSQSNKRYYFVLGTENVYGSFLRALSFEALSLGRQGQFKQALRMLRGRMNTAKSREVLAEPLLRIYRMQRNAAIQKKQQARAQEITAKAHELMREIKPIERLQFTFAWAEGVFGKVD